MSLIDTITSHLPTAPGLLPKWLFFISVVSIFNSIQTYVNLELTKQVYGNKPEQVSPLSARTFGTWTLISAIVRYYTSFHTDDVNVYNICIASYCVALWHFGSEWLWYRTCRFDKGLFGPLIVSTLSITWMLTQKEFYTGVAA
ncbi:DEKNAAC102659 [Brettanomyces naardenensis]|uniref:DEKNAAC102659 n=1 Tax=Brettanomyces naardenensis TaxID=13370 RepID=A0A448YK92_BRENA|nr:DEKNAAC102659 [Brettanomyces naardenensis]